MQLMTIGYEGISSDLFWDTLVSNGVQTLVDVRELPLSRKRGFSKSPLKKAALTHNINYVHMRALGCPKEIRHDYRADKDWSRYVWRFKAYLDTQEEAVNELAEQAQHELSCLLCYEADPCFCHRSIVAARVAESIAPAPVIVHLIKTTEIGAPHWVPTLVDIPAL